MRKALVKTVTGLVVNVIEIESGANWPIPAGHTLVDAAKAASPGDTWDGVKYVRPPATAEEVLAEKREAARVKAVAAILTNKTGAPWGVILYDLAVGQGLIEPAG